MSAFIRFARLGLLAALLSMLSPALSPAAPPKPKTGPTQARKGRDTQVIDGTWKFRTDPMKTGEAGGWTKGAPGDVKTTSIPALWHVDAAPDYSGVAWYWREFDAPANWKGQTVRLRFEAVAEKAQVWLNGEKLGEHIGGATPFEFNITKSVHIGGSNQIAVRVEGDSKRGAGLWQGVLLMAHDEAYLSDVFTQGNANGRATAAVSLLNTSDKSGDATLEARVVALNAPAKELKRTKQNLHLTPALNLTSLLISVRGKDLKLWTLDDPFLYSMQFAFRQDTDILDTQETLFGFRDLGYANGAITLNGAPLKPLALALRPDRPIVVASAEDTERLGNILHRAKNADVNILYVDAPPPALLRLADEQGIFVIEGARPNQSDRAAADELHDLILRDRSHPSVLGWNLGDDENSVQSIRQLDPSRFLLAGAMSPKLYPPNQATPAPGPLPTGLLPAK